MNSELKSVLVTGGCGFIGSNLVDRLVNEGYDVHVIDNLSTGLKSNVNEKASYYFDDINKYRNDEASFENMILNNNIKTVYHLAACADVRKSIENPVLVYDTNVLSSISIINICLKVGIKKFVFASTSAVYGEPKYLPVDEEHKTEPISPYGLTKLAFEQYLNYINMENEILIITFRFPNVYGPRQRPDLEGGVVAIFDNSMKGNNNIFFFGDGTQSRDWVHVNDIVDALLTDLEFNGKHNIISLGSGNKTALIELFNIMKGAHGYNKLPIYKPERKGDIKHMVMSGKKAHKLLNWNAKITINQGINLM